VNRLVAAVASSAVFTVAAGFGCSTADPAPLNVLEEDRGDASGPVGVVDGARPSDAAAPPDDAAPVLDPKADNDGDGFLFADDCDDRNPRVNPGAFEVPGDGIDNDCDGKVDTVEDCDVASGDAAVTTSDAVAFARALGICRDTTAAATGKNLRWGLVSAKLGRLDESAITGPGVIQYGILPRFGTNVPPLKGKNLVVLSTGTARTPGMVGFQDPRFNPFQSNLPSRGPSPPKKFASADACVVCDDCSTTPGYTSATYDSVVLTVVVRVPTNARSFTYGFSFYTTERPKSGCLDYPDTFATFLTSKAGHFGSAYEDNVALALAGANGLPVTSVLDRFFDVCAGCSAGTASLRGTGFDESTGMLNAATGWLDNVSPVPPGELATIRLSIFDGDSYAPDSVYGQGKFDSTVLLDDFRWAEVADGPDIVRRP
jgi:Putative metal-binding motif